MLHGTSCRAVALLWSLLLTGICVRAWMQPERNSVYPIFAQAGQSWRQQRDLYARHDHQGRDRYRYAPIVAAFLLLGFVNKPYELKIIAPRRMEPVEREALEQLQAVERPAAVQRHWANVTSSPG